MSKGCDSLPRMHRPRRILAHVLMAGALAACSRKPAEDFSRIADPVARERKEKDESFRSGQGSPLPDQDRRRFRGLDYFPVSPTYRFRVKLNRYENPLELRISTNTTEVRRGLRYGYFEFELEGRACRLQVYKVFEDNGSGGASLFVPFRDATSARETYGGGRYIDLTENTTGIYDLDLNRAYNPFCAYGGEYSCPLPPAENTLPVAVRAGEKTYHPPS